MSYRERHDTSPFLDHPPPSPWRTRAKDWRRRPLLTRQVAFVGILLVFAIPLWWLSAPYRQDYSRTADVPEYNDYHLNPTPSAPWSDPPAAAQSSVIDVAPPVIFNKGTKRPHKTVPVPSVPDAVVPAPDPPTFSLIMWSVDSAAEGAVLMKSIILYSSGPVHFHIICDSEAQEYLEKRLALLKQPMYNILVRFYHLNWSDMVGRIEREGAINTDHSAGIPGLMKLFIHEILPPTVKRAIFIDTDAFFISDPLLLWKQFDTFGPTTAISMPSHPEQSAEDWHHANRICSCIMLLDLERLRTLRLMDSEHYRAAADGHYALAPAAFEDMFGKPSEEDGKYKGVKLGDQGYWWAIVSYRQDLFKHLPYDWEVSSCLLDMYMTGLGHDDASEEDEIATQVHTWATPQQGQAVLPKMLHFNCLDGTPRYYDWEGWSDPYNSLSMRWNAAVRYHVGFKWLWLNQASTNETKLTTETIFDVKFGDELFAQEIRSKTPSSGDLD